MSKKRDILLVVMFCGFIGIMALGTAFLPKRDFSVNEKRALEKFPEFSFGRLFSGKWENDFENYISDHFPGRNFFTAVDSYYTLYTGRNGAKGVYKGKDGYLINTPVEYNNEALYDNLTAINAFVDKTGLKATIIAVPTAGYIMPDKLPAVHKEYNDEYIIKIGIEKGLEKTEFIDLLDEFERHKEDMQLYYKTDHHWTSQGAYLAYLQYAKTHGFEPETDFDIHAYDGFYGTSYTKSALWNEKPDSIEIWEYPINADVVINDGIEDEEYKKMFFTEHLDEPDKYPVYLDGNHAFERITNHDSDGGKLLVLKDSYAHCLVPFLAKHYSCIDMVDLRYYLDSVSKLTEENEYDEVLMIYGISSLCESRDISILE
ncbi:MAG: DHHW family protein [Clostridia bacterium]